MGAWTWGPRRICLALMPRTADRGLITLVTQTAPICLGHRPSRIREVRHPCDGAHSWTLVNRHIQMARSSKRTTTVRSLTAQPFLLRIHTMGPVAPEMNRHVWIRDNTPLTSPPIPVGPRGWMLNTTRTRKPVFLKADRSCHPAIEIGTNLPTPRGIAHWMPRLSRVGNIMVINGGTILSLLRTFSVVDIGTHAEGSLSTAMILFSCTAGLWMHGKIAAHSSVVRWWIGS